MEEILKRMEEMLELVNSKENSKKEMAQVQEMKENVEKSYREKNLIMDSMLKDLKQEEIEKEENKLNEFKKTAEENQKNLMAEVDSRKGNLIKAIENEKAKYKRQSEIDSLNEEVNQEENKKEAYQKVADNAKKTIDKIQNELAEGDFKNVHLLKNVQEEYNANLLQIQSMENKINEQRKIIENYKAVEKYSDEYADLVHFEARMRGISYDNFEEIKNEGVYQNSNNKQQRSAPVQRTNSEEKETNVTTNKGASVEPVAPKADNTEEKHKKAQIPNQELPDIENIIEEFKNGKEPLSEEQQEKIEQEISENPKQEIPEELMKKVLENVERDEGIKRLTYTPNRKIESKVPKTIDPKNLMNDSKEKKEAYIDPKIIMNELNKKIKEIIISEKDKKVITIYANEKTGEPYKKEESELLTWKDLDEKSKIKRKTELKKMCKEIAGGRIKGLLLRRNVNMSVVNVLGQNKKDLEKYLTAINEKEQLPFELIHDLGGLNPVQKFIKQHRAVLKREEECGAKIVNKLFDKNIALKEANEVQVTGKHASPEGKKELEEAKNMSKEEKKKILEGIKVDNKNNKIEENANRSMKQKSKDVQDNVNEMNNSLDEEQEQ